MDSLVAAIALFLAAVTALLAYDGLAYLGGADSRELLPDDHRLR